MSERCHHANIELADSICLGVCVCLCTGSMRACIFGPTMLPFRPFVLFIFTVYFHCNYIASSIHTHAHTRNTLRLGAHACASSLSFVTTIMRGAYFSPKRINIFSIYFIWSLHSLITILFSICDWSLPWWRESALHMHAMRDQRKVEEMADNDDDFISHSLKVSKSNEIVLSNFRFATSWGPQSRETESGKASEERGGRASRWRKKEISVCGAMNGTQRQHREK